MGNAKYFWDVYQSRFCFLVPFMRLSQNLHLFRKIYFDPSFLFPVLVLLPTLSSFFPTEFRLANFPGGGKFYLERLLYTEIGSGISVPQNVSLPGLGRICPS